ncbi:MAG: thioredoxin domain-containing protein, partial [Deltaproteobacteria bacterium]|nr:thioredoxin domain-containing protein [Deltaproteobacteria bacterium]
RQALDNHTHQARIQQDMQLAARLGARGTPAFFINGRQLMGAQPYEEFKRIIDEEITRANRVLATGVQRTRLYAELTKNGRTSAPDPAARGAAGAAGAGANAPQPPRRTEDPTAVYRVPVTADQPSKGARNALVTIVEFSEYQCPFCKRVGPTVAQILERYPTQVRIVWRDNPLPFHDNAMPAAELAREAFAQRGAEGFWRAHDLLFENQQALTRADLDRYAEQLGLNMTRYRAAMDGHTHQAAIQADQAIARQFGASGTPSFFINGVKLRGAQPFEAFQRVIDEQIAKAQEAIRAGRATAANVYDVLTRDGATAPVMRDAPAAPGGQQPAANREPAEDPNRVYAIAVPARAPMKGNARARVTIQIFSDFECPFCSRVLPTIRQIEEQYGDRVRFVWRDYPLPFHQRATPAAEAAREVFTQRGSEAFWRYHDLLFQNQRDLSDETLARLAGEVGGINMDRFRAAMSGRTHQAAVRADMDAVQQAGARIGTPSFFINGRLLQGAQPIDAFRQAIDAALAAPAGAGANPRPAAGGGADAPRPRAPRPTAPPSGGQ